MFPRGYEQRVAARTGHRRKAGRKRTTTQSRPNGWSVRRLTEDRRSVALEAVREHSLGERNGSRRSRGRDADGQSLHRWRHRHFQNAKHLAAKRRIEARDSRRRSHRLDPFATRRHSSRASIFAVFRRAVLALRRGCRILRDMRRQSGKRAVIARDEPSQHRDERSKSGNEARLVGAHVE